MLISPQQAPPLARNNSKLLVFNNVFKISGIQASLSDLYQEKEDNLSIFSCFSFFQGYHIWLIVGGQSWPYYIGSKRGKLQACPHSQCCTLFPEGGVVWKITYSLFMIKGPSTVLCHPIDYHLSHITHFPEVYNASSKFIITYTSLGFPAMWAEI